MTATAHLVLTCEALEPMLECFVERLRFQLVSIFPADSPRHAVLKGYGVNLALELGALNVGHLRLVCEDANALCKSLSVSDRELLAPNGWLVQFEQASTSVEFVKAKQELVVTKYRDAAEWGVGRAGLRYRDLLPSRLGGAFIASHIRLLHGGPVPDYVHYHRVRFQLIYCRKGWVDVVYEGQGEPFRMQAGDCVLQPPTIRHRVLAGSQGAEVVEVVGPAEHTTLTDPDMPLPSTKLPTTHRFGAEYFGGQEFVWSRPNTDQRTAWRHPASAAFRAWDSGIGAATRGSAQVRLVKAHEASEMTLEHHGEFCFFYVLKGELGVNVQAKDFVLRADDCVHLPSETPYRLLANAECEFLEVML